MKINEKNNSFESNASSNTEKILLERVFFSKTSKFPTSQEILEYFNTKVRNFDEERFLMLECLGEGGFGQVFKAFDKKHMRFAAIKNLKIKNNADDQKNLRGILQEYFILKQIKSIKSKSNRFLKYYHLYQRKIQDFVLYSLVMESGLSDIETISNLRKEKNDEYKEEEYCYILYKICGQLKKLEKNGISQRDIKPENLILSFDKNDRNFQYKLIDFGQSYQTAEKKIKTIPIQSITGVSFRYVAPEVKQNLVKPKKNAYNPYKSDVFSLGKTFLELIASDKKKKKEKLQILHTKYKQLEPLIRSMIEKDHEKRPSFSELKRILGKLQKKKPNEEVYAEEIQKKLKNKNNDLNSILMNIKLFLNFDDNACHQYCQIAIEKVQNENFHWETRVNAFFTLASYFFSNYDINKGLTYLKMGQELEIQKTGKNNLETIELMLTYHILSRNLIEVEKIFDQYLTSNPTKENLVRILDMLLPWYIFIDFEKAQSLCMQSIELKNKIYLLDTTMKLFPNYLYLAFIDCFNSQINSSLIKKIKNMAIELEMNKQYFVFYSIATFYYVVLFLFQIQQNNFDEIETFCEDIQMKINKSEKIFGKEHQFTKNLVILKTILTPPAISNNNASNKFINLIDNFLDNLEKNSPFSIKKLLDKALLNNSDMKVFMETKFKNYFDTLYMKCNLCNENHNSFKPLIKLDCNHTFCDSCLMDLLKQQIEQCNQNEILFLECPNEYCSNLISEYQLKKISIELYDKFINLQQKLNLGNEKLVICPYDRTLYYIRKKQIFFTCGYCKIKICSKCLIKKQNHKNYPCGEL